MDSCMRAYSTVQQLLCHGGYCELILSLARTSCRLLFTARPTARLLAGNPLRDVVRSRNPSKSTLVHDAVATAVLLKHHPSICVGAGLIQFVYRSHLRSATEATHHRTAFSPFFVRVSLNSKIEWTLHTLPQETTNKSMGNTIYTSLVNLHDLHRTTYESKGEIPQNLPRPHAISTFAFPSPTDQAEGYTHTCPHKIQPTRRSSRRIHYYSRFILNNSQTNRLHNPF